MKKNTLIFVLVNIAFGSIGIFIKPLTLSSVYVVFARYTIGVLFLLSTILFTKRKLNFNAIKKNIIHLLICGTCLGLQIALLVKSYKGAGVGTATLIYSFAPVIVFLLSPYIFKEKLTKVKVLAIFLALIGLVIINGVALNSTATILDIGTCILASIFFSISIIANKLMKDIEGFEATLVQLTVAALVLLAVLIITKQPVIMKLSAIEIRNLLIIGVFHTGICYYLYFEVFYKLPAQTVTLLSYLDPLFSVIFACIFLSEPFGIMQFIGTSLVLFGSALPNLKRK